MAYCRRSLSPPRSSSAPRFAYIGASDHAAEKEDENNTQNHKEDAAEDEDEVLSMADSTHLAASILDQAMQRISESAWRECLLDQAIAKHAETVDCRHS